MSDVDKEEIHSVVFYEKKLQSIKLEVYLNYNPSPPPSESEKFTIDNPLIIFEVTNLVNPDIVYERMSLYLDEFETIESALEDKLKELNNND